MGTGRGVLGVQSAVDQPGERFGRQLDVWCRARGAGDERDAAGRYLDGEASLRAGGGDREAAGVAGGLAGEAGDQLEVVDDERGDRLRDGRGRVRDDLDVPGVGRAR